MLTISICYLMFVPITVDNERDLEERGFNQEVANRDKSGTKGGQEKTSGSQVVIDKLLASRVSFGAERTGFEPADGTNPVTDLANRRFRPLSHLSGRWAG